MMTEYEIDRFFIHPQQKYLVSKSLNLLSPSYTILNKENLLHSTVQSAAKIFSKIFSIKLKKLVEFFLKASHIVMFSRFSLVEEKELEWAKMM